MNEKHLRGSLPIQNANVSACSKMSMLKLISIKNPFLYKCYKTRLIKCELVTPNFVLKIMRYLKDQSGQNAIASI